MPDLTAKAIEDLARGVRYFRNHTFPNNRELYESLAEKQNPHTLFLTCGDSRIDPGAMTNTDPGQIFVERTPGNIVPVYSEGAAVGVSASIEYSILVLGVRNVVVCGHSACGAMKALLDPEELDHALPLHDGCVMPSPPSASLRPDIPTSKAASDSNACASSMCSHKWPTCTPIRWSNPASTKTGSNSMAGTTRSTPAALTPTTPAPASSKRSSRPGIDLVGRGFIPGIRDAESSGL